MMLIQSYAQNTPDVWDLRQCIDYAIQNNISIKQADVQARLAALQADQARYNLNPSVSGKISPRGDNTIKAPIPIHNFLASVMICLLRKKQSSVSVNI